MFFLENVAVQNRFSKKSPFLLHPILQVAHATSLCTRMLKSKKCKAYDAKFPLIVLTTTISHV